jgi:hypothetical protein
MKLIRKIKLIITGLVLSLLIGITMAWLRTNYATPFAITVLWALLLCIPSNQDSEPELPETAWRDGDDAELPTFAARGLSYGDEPL